MTAAADLCVYFLLFSGSRKGGKSRKDKL